MKEKHYIPEISELHPGFEYLYDPTAEWKYSVNCEDYEVACDLECDPISELRRNIINGKIRVKYLDKEDIEELGWEKPNPIEALMVSYVLNGYGLTYWDDDHRIYIGKKHRSGNTAYYIPMCQYMIIKNKSELKKLMKQLNLSL